MNGNAENQVAVFIDYENIELSLRSKKGQESEVDWSRVLETAVDIGRVVLRRAYGDWAIFSHNQRALLGLGIDLIHVTAKRGKNAADIRIVIDAMEMLIGEHSHISHVLLVSGDGDFTELVHRLRGNGKFVIGLGISGASAEYLINACDQFIFYDTLDVDEAVPLMESDEGETAVTFDIGEARQLLRRALKKHEGEWVSAGKIKYAMRGLNPAFSERNYNFSSFKSFLSAHPDLVQMKTAEGGHMEVLMSTDHDNKNEIGKLTPEALLDRYLRILSQQKIRMTPNEHRPTIVLRFHNIIQTNPGRSLNEQKEDLHAYFEETAPQVKYQYIHETVHQLFHTYCFTFDMEDEQYPEDVRLWDRKVELVRNIHRAPELLQQCDYGLLQRIGRKVNGVENIDRQVVARLLYGSIKGQKMLEHVDDMIADLSNNPEKRK